ncbi:hypothetical protein ES705_39636 [subsurface metagenome]
MNSILVFFVSVSILFGGEYQVDRSKNNMVKFISDAPIEDFEGVTDKIDGYIYWEGSDLTEKSEIYLEVDLNSLDTGFGLRNRHMRENYLETDKHPLTYFQGKITSVHVDSPEIRAVEAEGKIFIHGVEQVLKVAGMMIKDGSGYRIQINFIVKLSDFEIEIPSIMFYKIDEDMKMHLDFYIKSVTQE